MAMCLPSMAPMQFGYYHLSSNCHVLPPATHPQFGYCHLSSNCHVLPPATPPQFGYCHLSSNCPATSRHSSAVWVLPLVLKLSCYLPPLLRSLGTATCPQTVVLPAATPPQFGYCHLSSNCRATCRHSSAVWVLPLVLKLSCYLPPLLRSLGTATCPQTVLLPPATPLQFGYCHLSSNCRATCRHSSAVAGACNTSMHHGTFSVCDYRRPVGPRSITSPTGRLVFEDVGPAVPQLHLPGGWSWWKEIMGCGVSTENIGCPMCLSSNIDALIR